MRDTMRNTDKAEIRIVRLGFSFSPSFSLGYRSVHPNYATRVQQCVHEAFCTNAPRHHAFAVNYHAPLEIIRYFWREPWRSSAVRT